MPPIVCGTLSIVLIVLTLGLPASAAEALPAADLDVMRVALAAAQGGDWTRAYADASAITDPLPMKMLHWMDYARPGAPGRFPDISEFIERNPDWPAQKALRKHAEEALAGESDTVAADWFKHHPPVSSTGKLREAEIMMNSGDLEGGTAALRALWIAADFGPLDERNFLARHAASLRPEDHVQRIDRLLWDGQTDAARRMLPLVPPNYRLLAEARLALAAQAPKADVLVARVPPQLRSDPGLVFEQLRWRRKKDMTDAAVQILLAQPNDLVRPAAWWAERQAIARRVLAGGNAELAYRLIEQHGLIEGNAFSEAQFLLGLYCAALYEAAGAGLRALLAHPDAGRHAVCEGACRILGGTGRRGGRQARARGKVVRRRGRPHGDLLRSARRAPARARCAAASDPGTCPRCGGAGAIRRRRGGSCRPDFLRSRRRGSRQELFSFTWPTTPRPQQGSRCWRASPRPVGASISRSRWPRERSKPAPR